MRNRSYRKNPTEYPIVNLPSAISINDAIDIAYRNEIRYILQNLGRRANVLVECDKLLIAPVFTELRRILKAQGSDLRLRFIGGRSQSEEEGEEEEIARPLNIFQDWIEQIREIVQGGEPNTIIVIPHLDLLATEQGVLNDIAKEMIALLYENPDALILGFKDPEFRIPTTLKRLFTVFTIISGIQRSVLPRLLTQDEAHKLGIENFDPFALYKYVSGLNVVRFRQIIELILNQDRMDFDGNPQTLRQIYREIRELTSEELEIPVLDLWKDIGGYIDVKTQIQQEILDLLKQRDAAKTAEDIKQIEDMIPRGILFEGPPGTGKTLFAKAIANAIDATVIVISGPELKSKWVGESEQNLRNIFIRARASAPSIIIFDEIDSFATKRGESGVGGESSVQHSLVNQLLTEMDGFRKDELVFVVGTTNFAKSLDDALLRPGRFEFIINVPYPNERDRREILQIYNPKFGLNLSEDLITYIVSKTSGYVDPSRNARFSGDHLQSICRALKRIQLRRSRALTRDDIDSVDILRGAEEKGKTESPKVDLIKDIGGYKHVKEIIEAEIIEPISAFIQMSKDPNTDPRELAELESMLPAGGIIFEGPPGTGKTFFAKAIATAINARTIIVKGPELMSKWLGTSSENIRRIFSEARRDAPAIIVFDEFDSIASSRTTGEDDSGSLERNAVVNQLLSEMDGFRKDKLVFVIATTNLASSLDVALKDRPGRFEFVINIPYPNATDRAEIFGIYNNKFKLALTEEQIKYLVKQTSGSFDQETGAKYAGDHIMAICRELKRIQRKKQQAKKPIEITKEDIDSVKLLKGNFDMPTPTKDDEKAIAVHECGHALVASLLKDAAKPHRVTLEGEEHHLGPFYTQFQERKDIRLTQNQVVSQIAVGLAGKMAEELLTGQVSTGIYHDLMIASEIARNMVEVWGMGSFKESLYYETSKGLAKKTISPEREQRIDAEVEQILGRAQDVVRNILITNRDLLEKMIEELLIKRTLEWNDIENIIKKAKQRMRRFLRK